MKKEDAIHIIVNCAKEYQSQLKDRNILFVFGDTSKPQFMETKFSANNYRHLTGIIENNPEGGN